MKDYPQKRYREVHKSDKRLRAAIQEAWESITHATIQDLIRGMGDRCVAVVLAEGGLYQILGNKAASPSTQCALMRKLTLFGATYEVMCLQPVSF